MNGFALELQDGPEAHPSQLITHGNHPTKREKALALSNGAALSRA